MKFGSATAYFFQFNKSSFVANILLDIKTSKSSQAEKLAEPVFESLLIFLMAAFLELSILSTGSTKNKTEINLTDVKWI